MKIISLNCNHCGAPLDVSVKAKYVTCGFCESKLAIQHSGNVWSTEVLEELQKTTQTLVSDVAALKRNSEIEQLDRDWERKKENYLVRGKNGSTSLPNAAAAVFGSFVAMIFGVFWTIATASSGAPAFFSMFGVLFIGVAFFGMVTGVSKANAYKQAHSHYQRRRRELMRD
jgi:hypothetical protein